MVRILIVAFATICFSLQSVLAADLSKDAVNNSAYRSPSKQKDERDPIVLRAQILLDRAHVSPGVIDARMGENTKRALAAYEEMHGLNDGGMLSKEVWQKLTTNNIDALITYTISEDDVEGPFIKKLPDTLQKMAKLQRVAYSSPAELLAAKFHMDQDLLNALNKGADFGKKGTQITVANVSDHKPDGNVDHVEADKKRKAVIVYGKGEKLIAYYPASVGSKELPSPSGDVTIKHIARNPKYYYHPELNFKGVPDKSFTVPPGPNNPVGVVWIGLSKLHYGIHGTPKPARVGKRFSHGCVHLTNWDTKEFASLVKTGTHVVFTTAEKPLQSQTGHSSGAGPDQ